MLQGSEPLKSCYAEILLKPFEPLLKNLKILKNIKKNILNLNEDPYRDGP